MGRLRTLAHMVRQAIRPTAQAPVQAAAPAQAPVQAAVPAPATPDPNAAPPEGSAWYLNNLSDDEGWASTNPGLEPERKNLR